MTTDDLSIATRALIRALDRIERHAERRPDPVVLAHATFDCVRLAGLLAAIVGVLGALARHLAGGEEPNPRLADVAGGLVRMRSLLRQAVIAGSPALADLRVVRQALTGDGEVGTRG